MEWVYGESRAIFYYTASAEVRAMLRSAYLPDGCYLLSEVGHSLWLAARIIFAERAVARLIAILAPDTRHPSAFAQKHLGA